MLMNSEEVLIDLTYAALPGETTWQRFADEVGRDTIRSQVRANFAEAGCAHQKDLVRLALPIGAR